MKGCSQLINHVQTCWGRLFLHHESLFFSLPSPVQPSLGSLLADPTSSISLLAGPSPWASLMTGHWETGQFCRDLVIQVFTQVKWKPYLPWETLYGHNFWSSLTDVSYLSWVSHKPCVHWPSLPVLSLFAQCFWFMSSSLLFSIGPFSIIGIQVKKKITCLKQNLFAYMIIKK